ncbi:hypothetical protein [Hoeflea sp.]|uniref:hypothetical protein n=1 Tax=Hoeflea sp. TaxID=1940281 RepID=UPI00374798BF
MEPQRTIILVLGLLSAFVLAGCQTASLEDAAPTVVPAAGSAVVAQEVAAEDAAASLPASQTTVTRRNPGLTSIVPIEQTAPVESKEFVTSGARRTGQFPTFGRLPTAANTQLSEAERIAAEAEMTELLRARASTPDARAQYDARLRQLRALAESHARDTQSKIEN